MKEVSDSKEPSLKQTHNILSNLREKFPDKSFQITITAWHFDTETEQDDYQLGMLPGFDGTDYQHFDHHDWPPIIKKYREIMRGDYV